MQFQKKKFVPTLYTGTASMNNTNTNSKGFTKPSFNLDPTKINTNAKFDDIPDHQGSQAAKKIPSKPKGIKQTLRKDEKVEKPLTDKLTNIAIDTKTNTAFNVERRIDRLHTEKKEITQKPNFSRYQAPQSTDLDLLR